MYKTSPKLLGSDIVQEAVEKQFSLKLIELPSYIDEGVENAAFKLKTDKGSYLLKIFSSEEDIQDVHEEVKLYRFLTKHGIRAPVVLPSSRGLSTELLMTHSHSYPMLIMKVEFLRRVKPSTITKHELGKIGRTIAHMHKVLTLYPQVDKVERQIKLQDLKASDFNTFINSPNSKIFNQKEIIAVEGLHKKLQEFSQPKILAFLTQSVLHGDLALEHTLFLPDNDVYIFDFSDFCIGPVVWDLAVFLVHLYREEVISFERWEALQGWLINSYTNTFQIGEKEQLAIKYYMIRRIINEVVYLNNISYKSKKECDAKGVKRRYKLAEYLLSHTS